MLDTTEQTQPAETDKPTYRDIQRVALRDLVQLATECTTTEAEIEKKYQAALEAGKKESQRTNLDVNTRFKSLRDGLVTEYQQRIEQIEGPARGRDALVAGGRQDGQAAGGS